MASAARKAWNEAMKVTAGSAALPPSLQQRPTKRRSDRNKKQDRARRAKSSRALALSAVSDAETAEYKMAVWIDALEGVDPNLEANAGDDDEYDELEELDDGEGTSKKGKRRKTAASKSKAKTKPGAIPKRFLPRTLASILLEEASREDGSAKAFLDAQARLPKSAPQLPARKFCPVTGVLAKYTEPKTGIPYSNLKALEQIRERPPPWMVLDGAAAYMEAVKSIQDDRY